MNNQTKLPSRKPSKESENNIDNLKITSVLFLILGVMSLFLLVFAIYQTIEEIKDQF